MGAVFALFGGFYYWTPKIIGKVYNEFLGKIHFFTLFVGVNLTFFPQHFLGMAGLPRRIPDYPDAYSGWNAVSSFGSLISVSATLLFIYIIYNIFVSNTVATKNPWGIIGYYYASDSEADVIEAPSSQTIEWTLDSPIPLHAYNSLPKQS